jgi:hypothetical protein
MKIYFECDEGENMTNFRVAEAIVNLCDPHWELSAETIAQMVLLQVEAEKEKRK